MTSSPEHNQVSTPNKGFNRQSDYIGSDATTDDRPMGLRKGVRSCTNHPLCNFVSYARLSPQFQAFVTSLDRTHFPKSIQGALVVQVGRQLYWKK